MDKLHRSLLPFYFIYLADALIQSDAQWRKRGQTVPGTICSKGPKGEITLPTL